MGQKKCRTSKTRTVGRRSKYGAVQVWIDGIRFASKAEAARFLILSTIQLEGGIAGLATQPPFVLKLKHDEPQRCVKCKCIVTDSERCKDTSKQTTIRPIRYIADFAYRIIHKEEESSAESPETNLGPNNSSPLIVEDVKGKLTDVFKLKMKLFLAQYPEVDFRIVRLTPKLVNETLQAAGTRVRFSKP